METRKENPSKEFLESVAKTYNVDELYIIDEDLKVAATTFDADLDLDMSSFSQEYTDYLEGIVGAGRVSVDRVSVSTKTGLLKKYAYYSPVGSRIIFNADVTILDRIGGKSEIDLGAFLYDDFLTNVKRSHSYIADFDLFTLSQIDRWSLIRQGSKLDEGIAQRFLQGDSEIVDKNTDHRIYRLMSLSEHGMPGLRFVAAITIDDAAYARYQPERALYFLLFGITASLFTSIVLSEAFFRRFFTSRVDALIAGVDRINSTPEHRIELKGNDELSDTAASINRLAEEAARRDRDLRDLNAQLEQEVDRRTLEMQNAMAIAEEANRAKSIFLATMSHELRTPLNAIIGYAQFLPIAMNRNFDKDKLADTAASIERAGLHLLNVINSILDLSKIEAGQYELAIDVHPVRRMIEDAIDLCAPLIRQRDIQVELTCDPDATGRFDRTAMLQVTLNILNNAAKFSPILGRVTITAAIVDNEMRVTIADQGMGMDAIGVERALEPFQQLVSDDVTKAHGGTGLGLAIVKRIVDLHGGTLEIDSTPGVGTKVGYSLPQ
ncbi:MAG: HAMP domain-containing histidine kinase [Alphaproteobacteria bacterium]|nr:HAMP domain-containing histidine kinase [Alphaproteobacteria bacterium]